MFVKPAAGLRVFDPERKQFMPAEGMEVGDHDFYWVRLLRARDVVRATPPAIQTAAPSVQPAADQAPAESTSSTSKGDK